MGIVPYCFIEYLMHAPHNPCLTVPRTLSLCARVQLYVWCRHFSLRTNLKNPSSSLHPKFQGLQLTVSPQGAIWRCATVRWCRKKVIRIIGSALYKKNRHRIRWATQRQRAQSNPQHTTYHRQGSRRGLKLP